MSLKFKCPSCDSKELEVVQSNVVQTSQVVDIDEGGCFEFDLTDTDVPELGVPYTLYDKD